MIFLAYPQASALEHMDAKLRHLSGIMFFHWIPTKIKIVRIGFHLGAVNYVYARHIMHFIGSICEGVVAILVS